MLENKHINNIPKQEVDIINGPTINDDEEVDIEAMDLVNVNTQRGIGDRAHKEAVCLTNFDDIKEASKILIAQHKQTDVNGSPRFGYEICLLVKDFFREETKMSFKEGLNELQARMNQIPRAVVLIKGPDS
ncbi:hypothetical protein HAX54_020706 [Datura stramonium]|uniref:Uncharacterized protein n=1 Tax=Datura stramonium TaxID=4076 RepID=A0ABS8USS4_DATST|nr:hypothetical protein [Datura stramonium]